MTYDILVNHISSYAQSQNGIEKKKYIVLAKSIADDEFVALLDQPTRDKLSDLQNILSSSNHDFNWVNQNQKHYSGVLDAMYFNALSFEVAKTRNIIHFEERSITLEKNIANAQKNIDHINQTAELISGASILSSYAQEFDSQSKMHKANAKLWIIWLGISVIGLGILVALLLFFQVSEFKPLKDVLAEDIRKSGVVTAIALAIKVAVIIAYLQIPAFLKRNYFAEKHLEQANIHRRNVLRALHAVYNTIDSKDEKDKIITTGAAIAFSEAESGFITRKEGAGTDDLTQTLIAKIWK